MSQPLGKYVGNLDSPAAAGSDSELAIAVPPTSDQYRLCSTDATDELGEAVNRGCSSITVKNPSAATSAATLIDVFKRLVAEILLDIADSSHCVDFSVDPPYWIRLLTGGGDLPSDVPTVVPYGAAALGRIPES